MTHFAKAAKAYVASAVAGLSFLIPVVDDGLAVSEALGTLLAALVAWQAVYWVSNAEDDRQGYDPVEEAPR